MGFLIFHYLASDYPDIIWYRTRSLNHLTSQLLSLFWNKQQLISHRWHLNVHLNNANEMGLVHYLIVAGNAVNIVWTLSSYSRLLPVILIIFNTFYRILTTNIPQLFLESLREKIEKSSAWQQHYCETVGLLIFSGHDFCR